MILLVCRRANQLHTNMQTISETNRAVKRVIFRIMTLPQIFLLTLVLYWH